MNTQGALAGLEMYTSMTILPFEGVKGLSLYLKQKESARELMLRNLRHGKEFCDVAKKFFTEPAKAISENVSIYCGMKEVYKDNAAIKDIIKQVANAGEVIGNILNGNNPPSPEEVRESIKVLMGITEEAEKKIDRTDYERVIHGKYAMI